MSYLERMQKLSEEKNKEKNKVCSEECKNADNGSIEIKEKDTNMAKSEDDDVELWREKAWGGDSSFFKDSTKRNYIDEYDMDPVMYNKCCNTSPEIQWLTYSGRNRNILLHNWSDIETILFDEEGNGGNRRELIEDLDEQLSQIMEIKCVSTGRVLDDDFKEDYLRQKTLEAQIDILSSLLRTKIEAEYALIDEEKDEFETQSEYESRKSKLIRDYVSQKSDIPFEALQDMSLTDSLAAQIAKEQYEKLVEKTYRKLTDEEEKKIQLYFYYFQLPIQYIFKSYDAETGEITVTSPCGDKVFKLDRGYAKIMKSTPERTEWKYTYRLGARPYSFDVLIDLNIDGKTVHKEKRLLDGLSDLIKTVRIKKYVEDEISVYDLMELDTEGRIRNEIPFTNAKISIKADMCLDKVKEKIQHMKVSEAQMFLRYHDVLTPYTYSFLRDKVQM